MIKNSLSSGENYRLQTHVDLTTELQTV